MAFVTGRFQATKNDWMMGFGIFLILIGIIVVVAIFFISMSVADGSTGSSPVTLYISYNSGMFYLAGCFMIVGGSVSRSVGGSSARREISLALNVEGDAMTLFSTTKDGESVCEIEFKWHETIIIYEQIFRNSENFTYEILRTLQLRIWNEQTQVVIVGKFEDGLFPNYPVFVATDLHKPDFISLEKGVVAKMSELIEKRPVAPEKKFDLLDCEGIYENL